MKPDVVSGGGIRSLASADAAMDLPVRQRPSGPGEGHSDPSALEAPRTGSSWLIPGRKVHIWTLSPYLGIAVLGRKEHIR
jgi:hypothetical protein